MTVGIDAVSFKPMVRIYGSSSSTTPHISFLGKQFWSFISKLREILDDASWASEILRRSGITIKAEIMMESLADDTQYHFKGEYGDIVVCSDAAYEMA